MTALFPIRELSDLPLPGWIVKSAVENVWSGSDAGDPDNPALGRNVVFTRTEAHVFEDYLDARAEASTYNCGALVLPVPRKP